MSLTTALLVLAAAVLLLVGTRELLAWRRAKARSAAIEAAAAVPPASAQAGERIEPSLGGDEEPLPAASPTAAPRVPPLDPLIDDIVSLVLEAPVAGEFVIAHLPASRRAGARAFAIEGLDTETGEWEPVSAGCRYGELQAGVLLAGRSGPINEIEYSEFAQKVQEFAEGVGARADFPDMRAVVQRARELDAATAALDMQLSVTLRSEGASWSLDYLHKCASRHGFVPGALPGRLVLPDPDPEPSAEGEPLLVLAYDARAALAGDTLDAALRECTLLLDVARAPESAEPFALWHRSATALAGDLGAATLDEQGRPVPLAAFAAIGRDLAGLYERLNALGLPAGSAVARRLFN